eukprot:4727354-Prymnesium_polylepis.1
MRHAAGGSQAKHEREAPTRCGTPTIIMATSAAAPTDDEFAEFAAFGTPTATDSSFAIDDDFAEFASATPASTTP